MNTPRLKLAVRWTVGDVSRQGFEALNLSIWSAKQLFPPGTELAVCVNSISLSEARKRTGEIPSDVDWVDASSLIPNWLQARVDSGMAEGVAWKLSPVRLYPDAFEISLDNDVVLWDLPEAMRLWFHSPSSGAVLLAEDVQSALGQFSALANQRAINSGIRGLPPHYDYETDLRRTLNGSDIILRSELDEQGLQAATLCQRRLLLVSTHDVTICSPFAMHQHHLGSCGAHFVGLNRRILPWLNDAGRPMHEVIHAQWLIHAEEIESRISARVNASTIGS